MERQPLFRGQRTDTGEWVKGGFAVIGPKTVIVTPFEFEIPESDGGGVIFIPEHHEVNPATVGQLTDSAEYLNDKPTGRKIFEGDVVRLHMDLVFSPIPAEFTGVVRFLEGSWMVVNDAMQEAFPLWSETAQWEILGNEVDKPELKALYLNPNPQNNITRKR